MEQTTQQLRRWADGDESALGEVLRDHADWIREQVRFRLRGELRAKLESGDVVQDTMVEFLRFGPPVIPASGAQLRKLLMQIVEHSIRDHAKWFRSLRRQLNRERPLGTTTLDFTLETDDPSRQAEDLEREARLRLAIELLPLTDREVIVWREWDKETWETIGDRRGISADGARKAHWRAQDRLGLAMARLRQRDLDAALSMSQTFLDEESSGSS